MVNILEVVFCFFFLYECKLEVSYLLSVSLWFDVSQLLEKIISSSAATCYIMFTSLLLTLSAWCLELVRVK